MKQTVLNLSSILQRPVPDQTPMRQLKEGYRAYPLLNGIEHGDDPIVDIGLYGIAGQSYYSRPNTATGKPVPGVDPVVRVRRSIAEQLSAINHEVQNSDIVTELLGGQVELFVNEGVRAPYIQKQLYEDIFPRFIRSHHPKMTKEQIYAERDRLIAKPAGDDDSSPPPHETGAAVDICFRYVHPDPGYVPRSLVPMGRKQQDSSAVCPDYFEHKTNLSPTQMQYRQNRRVFYWTMRGALLGDDSGFMVNPDEWWHWSYGDQLWAALTHAPYAFFDTAIEQ